MTDERFEIAVFGGGCFWCTEAIFRALRGVISVVSGYAGGKLENPDYAAISQGNSGHSEVVKVEYNPKIISYSDLLSVFFATHDPTTPNRQGADAGPQYRSLILYSSPEQKMDAQRYMHPPIVTELAPLEKFFPAEDFHQNYYLNNPDKPYCQLVINPKLALLRRKFSKFVRA